MSENAAPGQQQTGHRRSTVMMLLPNYSIVEKMKQLSKFNQTKKKKKRPNFPLHDTEIKSAQESNSPPFVWGCFFFINRALCCVFQ